jgi:hypothetical protein
MAPLSNAAIRRPASPVFSDSVSSSGSDAGSSDDESLWSCASDRRLSDEHGRLGGDDHLVEWQALLTSTPPDGETSSLFAEPPEATLGAPAQQQQQQQQQQQPSSSSASTVCGGCVSWQYNATGERLCATSTWTTTVGEATAATSAAAAEPKVLMQLPSNFQELGLSRQEWQEQWRQTYDAWKSSDSGGGQSTATTTGQTAAPSPMVAVSPKGPIQLVGLAACNW